MPVPLLPSAASNEDFRRLGRAHPSIAEGAARIAADHGAGPVRLLATGSLPVFEVGRDRVLKLFPPCYAHEALHERVVLEHLHGKLPVRVPLVDAAGELDGWRYLLMERIPGEPLADAWPRLSTPQRRRVCAETGYLLAALHRAEPTPALGSGVPGGADHGVDPPAAWTRFVQGQKSACVEAQRARGADPSWLEQIPAFLEHAAVPEAANPVLLHTEIMREHLFVASSPSGWAVTGLVDFEPAMVGAAEYEFASVGIFLTAGDGPALRSLLLAYGYRESELGVALQRRFLAYALLHRYSNLRWYLERLPLPPSMRTLDDVAVRWWALGDEPALG